MTCSSVVVTGGARRRPRSPKSRSRQMRPHSSWQLLNKVTVQRRLCSSLDHLLFAKSFEFFLRNSIGNLVVSCGGDEAALLLVSLPGLPPLLNIPVKSARYYLRGRPISYCSDVAANWIMLYIFSPSGSSSSVACSFFLARSSADDRFLKFNESIIAFFSSKFTLEWVNNTDVLRVGNETTVICLFKNVSAATASWAKGDKSISSTRVKFRWNGKCLAVWTLCLCVCLLAYVRACLCGVGELVLALCEIFSISASALWTGRTALCAGKGFWIAAVHTYLSVSSMCYRWHCVLMLKHDLMCMWYSAY